MNNHSLKPEQVKIQDIGQRTYEKRKLALLECLRQYPGHTENWYADVMTLNHICARKTTLQIIRDFVSDGQINDNKIGNSFHSYSINHDDKYITFLEKLKEFQIIEHEFLSYYDKVWEFFYDDPDLKQIEGTSFWKEYDSQLYSQLTMLKVLAVDAVGILLEIYGEMVHKYDHIGDEKILHDILRIVHLVTAYGNKKSCLKWFNQDLNNLVTRTETDSVQELLRENGFTCEGIITRLTKFERDLNDKFMDKYSEDSADASKKPEQNFIDNYFDLNRPQTELPRNT